jgi:PAS domain S-box-containing protein
MQKGYAMDVEQLSKDQLREKIAHLTDALEKYRVIFDSASEGIVILQEDRIRLINNRAMEILGSRPGEIRDYINEVFIDFVHPEDRAMVMNNHVKRLNGESLPAAYEIRIAHKSGDFFWGGISPILIQWENEPAVLILINDISERKTAEAALRDSEERFRTLFDLSPQPIFLSELDTGRIISVNSKFCEMSGYEREEVLNRTSIQMGFFDEQTRREFISHLEEDGEINGLEGKYAIKDGTKIHVLQYCKILEIKKQKIIFIIIFDITEKKQMEARLAQAQKMEAIGTLAGGIAHDFNNILTIVVGNAELVQDDIPQTDPVHRKLQNILDASFRARDVVTQLLSFSRSADDEKLPLKIDNIVKESVRLLRATIPKNIDIRQEITNGTGAILANPSHINQLMINLCTNAAQAMRAGGMLEISLKSISIDDRDASNFAALNPGRHVLLSVKDTGTGIDPDIRERIFEPYFTTREFGQGHGLGLSVVHGIVKNLGGEIVIDSVSGKGTRIDIYLPGVDTGFSGPKEKEITPRVIRPGKRKKLLFVDDEELIVEIAHQLLENLGYAVESTTSAIEAFELFRSKPDYFDLVITDMTMPKLNGDQLIKNILSIRPDMPTVLCTGYNELISEETAIELGAKAFLMKPLRRDGMSKTIKDVLNKYERENLT